MLEEQDRVRYLKKSSIRRKLIWIIVITSGGALLLATTALAIYELGVFRSDIAEDLASAGDMLARSAQVALELNDPRAARQILNMVSSDKRISKASIYRADGSLLASFERNPHGSNEPAGSLRVISSLLGNALIKRIPVTARGKTIGEIYLEGDLTNLLIRIRSYLVIIGGVALISHLLVILASSRLQRVISEPIIKLANVASEVTNRKDYSLRASRMTDDEIGDLVLAFNQMLAEIQSRDEALRESEERYRTLVEHQQEGLGVVDLSECFVFANPAAHEIFGVPQGELVGKCLSEFLDENGFELVKAQTRLRSTVKRTTYDLEITRPDGERRVILITASPRFDKEGNFTGTFGVFRDITVWKHAEERLKRSLEEKEVLLREIHHRVKNNLQIISSLLYLQSRSIADGKAVEIFKESQNRIRSMALIHETLYRSDDLAHIDLSEYIHNLIKFLITSYNVSSGGITFKVDIADVSLSMDTAVPCGLIINELVSNSLKHAFNTGKGRLWVKLHRVDDNQFEIVVKDDGIGLPSELDIDTSPTLGLRLVKTLVKQIDGRLEATSCCGTEFRILFSDKAARRWVPCKL